MTNEQRNSAPEEKLVTAILKRRFSGAGEARRVPTGVSTYVYRIAIDGRTCYARFLPEDATFGVEVLAQRQLLELGVPVPEVILYEPREPVTGRSLMVARELPGRSLAEDFPEESWKEILRDAARSLRLLHTVPVKGFGWIDRSSEDVLKGEHPTFSEYFTEFLEEDLSALPRCGFSREDADRIRGLMEEAQEALGLEQAVLVHGDLSLDHIFHENGRFTGFIDFGEIRGNHPFFDLGDFLQSDPTPDGSATAALLEGYGSVRPLGSRDLRAIRLSAMAFDLRFLGRKADTEAIGFWKQRLLRLLPQL